VLEERLAAEISSSGTSIEKENRLTQKITDLEKEANMARNEKESISAELVHSNTKLLQLEENTGASQKAIVDLEKQLRDQGQTITEKENIILKLTSDFNEKDAFIIRNV
jgi:predicted  nucleic acid-binding Zn-ribbon protein